MTIVKLLQHVTPQALGILQLMWLANHHEFLMIINTNLEQKMGSPSEGVDRNSGAHRFPEFFSGATESAVCFP